MLEHLRSHLKGKVVILGIGNTLRSDDGIGAILAQRIKDTVEFTVWDSGVSPENYLGKIIRESPDTLVIIDAVDFGGSAGEIRELEAGQIQTANLFSTHNSSISLLINFLQSQIKVDIIALIIQPKSIALGENLSPEVAKSLTLLEEWFSEAAKAKG